MPYPFHSAQKNQLLTAYKSSIELFKQRGFTPQLQRLDNEASELLQEYMHDEKNNFQLTSAGTHRRNSAERAIQTLKDHIISGLYSCDPKLPLHLWDRLIPQAIITLNLMRPSNLCPQLSAYDHVHGAFDYNRTPLAPPGIKVLAHLRLEDRPPWSPHAIDGLYVGPAMRHYRCHNIYIPSIVRTRISQTVRWFPHNFKILSDTREETIISAPKDLTAALISKNHSTLLPPINKETRKELIHLASLFSLPPHTMTPSAPQPRVPHSETLNISTPSASPTVTDAREPRVSPTVVGAIEPRVPPVAPVTELPTQRSLRQQRREAACLIADHVKLPIKASFRQRTPHKNSSGPPEFIAAINSVLHPDIGKLQDYRHLRTGEQAAQWVDACSKEVARLCNGCKADDTKGTNTTFFLHPSTILPGKQTTYLRIVSAYRPQKADPFRIQWTCVSNLVDYPGVTYTPTADMTTIKILLNSIISTKNARFCNMDLKDFYLNNPM